MSIDLVLHEPEQPGNTGAIGRTCLCAGSGLHLIRPLGFSTDEKSVRRAGLDYWPRLRVREYDGLDAFYRAHPNARIVTIFSDCGPSCQKTWKKDRECDPFSCFSLSDAHRCWSRFTLLS